ncbi:hypothetical protein [Paenarthrobacter nicotinovorans]|uniref:hypothetical protein n=1 Tax=Paenarthrobacter nicotinovorans TaxID=29320 RepID=UPI001642F407|nr:hypothetical protein [Paenarthrobacter nicotinovorans]
MPEHTNRLRPGQGMRLTVPSVTGRAGPPQNATSAALAGTFTGAVPLPETDL